MNSFYISVIDRSTVYNMFLL